MEVSYEELKRIEQQKQEMARKQLEQDRIAQLEGRVKEIELLRPVDPVASNRHVRSHQWQDRENFRIDKRMDAIEESLEALATEVCEIRLALLRFASDESVHDLLG